MIEALEARIAPATLVNATTVTYQDVDGDLVTVKVSKPIFTEMNVASIFSFAGSSFGGTGGQALSAVDLRALPTSANGLNLTVTAKPSPTAGGNGSVAIHGIDASDVSGGAGLGIDLGIVSVQGEIAYIDAGDTNSDTLAIKALTVQALGILSPNIHSEIEGNVGSITVRGSVGGYIDVEGPLDQVGIAKLSIGGSVYAPTGEGGGRIYTISGFGTIVVKGSLIGGSEDYSGRITSPNAAKSVTIGGSIVGGDGLESGLLSFRTIGKLNVGGDLVGGDGTKSGSITAYYGGIPKGLIGGSLIGGTGNLSGRITAGGNTLTPADIGTLLIKGSILGQELTSGDEGFGAGVYANGSILNLTILGDVVRANIIAGVVPGPDGRFGDVDLDDPSNHAVNEPEVISKIAKLTIKGLVMGSSSNGGDSYAIQANDIVYVKIGTAVYKETNPGLNFWGGIQLAPTEDFILREVS